MTGSPCKRKLGVSARHRQRKGPDMNTTTRQGFTAEGDNFTRKAKRIYCAGANHKDMATFGCCDGCGAFVAKTASGRIVPATTGSTNRMSYCCW